MALQQPKKPVGGAFGRFSCEKRAEFTKLCEGQKASAVLKMLGEAWKNLSEADKAPYVKAYEEAKKAFDVEWAAFIAGGGVKSKGVMALRAEKRKAKQDGGKCKRAKKDANAPKRPAGGAFGCFLAANRKNFEKQCPGSIVGVTKLASEKWKAASQAEKEKYGQEYTEKKAAYEEAMKSYVPPAVEADDKDGEEQNDKKEKTTYLQAKKTEAAEKKAKKAEASVQKANNKKTGRGRKPANDSNPQVDIPKEVSDKAEKAGLNQVLKKLLARDDIKSGAITPNDALAALEQSGGLMHRAREALLLSGA